MWNDFKAFAFKGNVIDLAVGVVIGAAFTAIVDALVKGVVMPVVGAITPQGQWQTWTLWKLQIGSVLAASINFIIVAFVLFLVVSKIIKAIQRKEAAAPPPPPPLTTSEKLLMEIRDQLRQRG